MGAEGSVGNNRRMAQLNYSVEDTVRGLLADKAITVVVAGEAKYEWRTKTMYIPDWTEEPEDPLLRAAWNGLVDHECAHAQETDFGAVEEYLQRWNEEYPEDYAGLFFMANAIEDGRIERVWPQVYSGSEYNLWAKNKYLLEKLGGPYSITDPSKYGPWRALGMALKFVASGAASLLDVHEHTLQLMGVNPVVQLFCEEAIGCPETADAMRIAEGLWKELGQPDTGVSPEQRDSTAGAGQQNDGALEDGEVAQALKERITATDEDWEPPTPQEIGGARWGHVVTDHEVIASAYLDQTTPPYTVHPDSRRADELVKFDAAQRREGRERLASLQATAGPPTQRLVNMMQSAIQASTTGLVVGGLDDGEELDPNALPSIGLGFNDHAVFQDEFVHVEESTGVLVLVDCSGSMGSSQSELYCKIHGLYVSARYDGKRRRRCPECGAQMVMEITNKAGYAAVTAAALHKALRTMQIEHAVLGYTTGRGTTRGAGDFIDRHKGYARWSRASRSLKMLEFVPAPGIYDDGSALPYITGVDHNLDGESVLFAAKYAAERFDVDRVIMLVIADGLPAGADDCRIEGPYLQRIVRRVARAGIEVYGVGVGIGNMDVFRSYYPEQNGPGTAPTGCIEIPYGEGLSEQVLRKLTALLTRGYASSRQVGGIEGT